MHRRDLPWHQKDANADVLQARPLCSPSAPSPSTSKDTKPFVHNAIFLFRTRSVNKILSLLTSVVLPCLFFPPLSFPSCLYLPGDISCVPSLLSSGIFLLQGIMASTFFFPFAFIFLFLILTSVSALLDKSNLPCSGSHFFCSFFFLSEF